MIYVHIYEQIQLLGKVLGVFGIVLDNLFWVAMAILHTESYNMRKLCNCRLLLLCLGTVPLCVNQGLWARGIVL